MEIILSHENADFDSVGSMLGAHKLHPHAYPVLAERLNRNVAGFLSLYSSALPFVTRQELPDERLRRVIVTDVAQPPQYKGITKRVGITIYDHHPLEREPDKRTTYLGEVIGATCTLMAERLRAAHIGLTSLEATLMALGIYEDTGSLQYNSTTPRDLMAAAWLREQGADLDVVQRFLDPPLAGDQQPLFEALVRSIETRVIEGYAVMLGSAVVPAPVAELRAVAHKLVDTFDPAALILVIHTPDMTNIVCRSRDDAVDVGELARLLGGGGHPRAAAAVLHEPAGAALVDQIWRWLADGIRSTGRVARVRDLMSYGAHAFPGTATISSIITRIHQIGHEGYPVLADGRVVGVLVRREADRAMEHGLGHLTSADVMTAGDVTVRQDASLSELEQKMVETDLGQLPVVDEEGLMIGIVTRTDLIRHWVRTHPDHHRAEAHVTAGQLRSVLGQGAHDVLHRVAALADETGAPLYLAGGAVRDLLLGRQNLDIDVVMEGNAIAFAEQVAARLGGELTVHVAFGTAHWSPPQGGDDGPVDFPEGIDFVTARNEYYLAPTALPTVYQGSIKLDLRRRDFSINAIAMRLTPAARFGEIVDYYEGVPDLQSRVIRVLHSLSFLDDPTRILRAVRFEQRLNFDIEPRTMALLNLALPMLERVSGQRLTHEFDLLLRENSPERGLLLLENRGILRAIHPALRYPADAAAAFGRARDLAAYVPDLPQQEVYWAVWLGVHAAADADSIAERLALSRARRRAAADTARLLADSDILRDPAATPSRLTALLEESDAVSRAAVFLLSEDPLVRGRLRLYNTDWRLVQPRLNGDEVRALGVPAGPAIGRALRLLRDALLDRQIEPGEGEGAFVAALLREVRLNDGD